MVPGFGQIYKGQRTKGRVIQAASLLTAGIAVYGYVSYQSAEDDYNEARDQYDSAVSQDDIDLAYAQMEEEWDSVENAEKILEIGTYAFIGVYVLNLVDAALGFPLEESQVGVSAGSTGDGQARLAFTLGAHRTVGNRALTWPP